MHPHLYLHRPVSRVFWFLVGAGAATWWHHSHHRSQYWSCMMQQHRRAALQDQQSGPASPESVGYHTRGERPSWTYPAAPAAEWNQQDWEDNKERLKNLQKRVSDAMVDMSEVTLDSIVSAAEALRVKLAERRPRPEGSRPSDLHDGLRKEGWDQKKDPTFA